MLTTPTRAQCTALNAHCAATARPGRTRECPQACACSLGNRSAGVTLPLRLRGRGGGPADRALCSRFA
jgi:hypothetical protein